VGCDELRCTLQDLNVITLQKVLDTRDQTVNDSLFPSLYLTEIHVYSRGLESDLFRGFDSLLQFADADQRFGWNASNVQADAA
jgi:hypothetical protein